MSIRLWYPQLDVYDCIRRISLLLNSWPNQPCTLERLYISDFYLANPPLIYNTTMTKEVRKSFTDLNVVKPDKTFVSFPSAQILFHKMEPIQKQALQTIIGKGLIEDKAFQSGVVTLTDLGKQTFKEILVASKNAHEIEIASFIAKIYSQMAHNDMKTFRRNSGLRRVA